MGISFEGYKTGPSNSAGGWNGALLRPEDTALPIAGSINTFVDRQQFATAYNALTNGVHLDFWPAQSLPSPRQVPTVTIFMGGKDIN